MFRVQAVPGVTLKPANSNHLSWMYNSSFLCKLNYESVLEVMRLDQQCQTEVEDDIFYYTWDGSYVVSPRPYHGPHCMPAGATRSEREHSVGHEGCRFNLLEQNSLFVPDTV